MSTSDKKIPTLDEMIFPGRTDKTQTTKSAQTTATPAPTLETKPAESAQSAQPKRTNFETMINRQIDSILDKHMQAARSEIVRVVMLELRSRLPVTNRNK